MSSEASVQGYVWWSILVRTSSVRKAREKHLPPIEAALEGTEFKWQVSSEKDLPGLIRLVNYQNLQADSVTDVIVTVLRRAYRLTNSWTISGLHDLVSDDLRAIIGRWDNRGVPSSKAPALEDMMFDLQKGNLTQASDGCLLLPESKKDLYVEMPKEWPKA